jgi:DnaJ-domain-containing protein 1
MKVKDKSLRDLTDRELEEELARRRRARGGTAPEQSDAPRMAAAVKRAQVKQWLKNLELEPGASEEDIRAAYTRLMAKYHPDKHGGDPEKHRAATKLAHGLTEAYHGLLEGLASEKR